MKVADALDLLRIPAAFTALSDVVLGAALVSLGHGIPSTQSMIGAAVASVGLYAGGMALNDLADRHTDQRERPERPIPSGRVTVAQAAVITAVLFIAAAVSTLIVSPSAAPWALALLAAVALYDLGLAGRAWIGPLGMALCRALNVALAVAIMHKSIGPMSPAVAWVMATHFVYVFGLTHLSLGESGQELSPACARRTMAVTWTTTGLAVAAGVGLGVGFGPNDALTWIAAAAAATAFAWRGPRALARAWREPVARRIGPAVGALVGGILWLGAFEAAAVAGPWWILPFLGLALGHELTRRSFRVT